jgi:hypothetical protein
MPFRVFQKKFLEFKVNSYTAIVQASIILGDCLRNGATVGAHHLCSGWAKV